MNAKDRPPGGEHRGPEDQQLGGGGSAGIVAHAGDIALESLPPHLARVEVDPVTGEWIWAGPLDRWGYGKVNGRGAHRAVWEHLNGPVPPGKVLDHVKARGCTTTACVSPWHLEPVTHRVNVLRGRSFAAVNARKTRCGTCGRDYDLFNTYVFRGRRDCRACIRDRVKRYRKRKRAHLTRAELGRAA